MNTSKAAARAELAQWLADLEQQRATPNRGGRPVSSGVGSRSRKLECERCGFIARTSLAALERSGFPTCGCGRALVLAELADRAKAGDADALETLERADGAQLERAARAEIRRATRDANAGFETRAANCAVCGRFKSRPADVCAHCGDEPATYGPDVERERRVHNRGYGYAA